MSEESVADLDDVRERLNETIDALRSDNARLDALIHLIRQAPL